MTHLIVALLSVALALPPPWYAPGQAPETPAQRDQRIETIVEASVLAAQPAPEGWPGTRAELSSALLAISWWEGIRWRLDVHQGRKRGDHDPRLGRGHSCGLAQLWDHCDHMGTSLEATTEHFREAAEILARSAAQCRVRVVTEHTMRRAIGMYGSGKRCGGGWARPYARLWERFRASTVRRPGPTAVALLEPTKGTRP